MCKKESLIMTAAIAPVLTLSITMTVVFDVIVSYLLLPCQLLLLL